MTETATTVRLERLEKALATLAWWLVDAQTGMRSKDASTICAILDGERDDLIEKVGG